ncbi:23S rRNA (uracil(1939)-C(5))-methyltransferase RlmD [Taibaiella sp. KBW10]|uniref:23S rRNA (uracil(1939)-C(5))-methyltransferase RlmD n=1 Tax=Taibaiella sp. KBW10 TaxID=2153357 RepID=UPI000F595063|nr:23S rRNA (uracil(1939)-C(5))-methyltransferase RlmD [Taibaiella sp. KBW10]RQO32695.1 23S rRNA (uracil(1939)-C(5))-methyltransferase RlmD [Taibaiella sp. KBW10]
MGRKNKKTILSGVRLEKYAAEGKSIAHLEDGKTLLVEGGVPGDVAQVLVLKNKKSYAEGKVMKIEELSAVRETPFCDHFGVCGGCKWQMLPYNKQIEYKQQQVADQLRRIGNIELPEMETICGSNETRFYRNKLEFTFSTQQYLTQEALDRAQGEVIERKPALGFHAPGMFDKVVDIETCYLQPDPSNKIKNWVRKLAEEHDLPYYDFKKQEGWLRTMVVRVATTKEVMVNLVVHHERPELFMILDTLLAEVPEITSLNYTINPKKNDTIYDLQVVNYHGKAYIEEYLESFRFKISPKSFFQTNTKQAERLYQITRDFAGLTGSEVLYDLYCGTGSIGIFCSKGAKRVIGIEAVADAIEDAKINAAWNNLEHCDFYAGDVSDIATDAFFEQHGRPDVIITDPPRAGMHEKLIQQLLRMRAPRVVYVSCNPATQARDLQLLDEAYAVIKIQPVDMFPHTHHIENVVLLELK